MEFAYDVDGFHLFCGDALDVMPQGEHAIPIETAIDPASADIKRGFGELSDLPSR